MNHLTLPYRSNTLLLFEQMRDLPHPVLLHSGDRSTTSGHYDIPAADPARILRFDAGVLTVGSHRVATSEPLTTLHGVEPVARSIYCGRIDYVDSTGAMDTNIAIQTLAFISTGVHCWKSTTRSGDCFRP